MLRSDVPLLIGFMGELWPHYRPPEVGRDGNTTAYDVRVQAWMDVLGDLDGAAVRAGIASLAEREYAPSPGQVRAAVMTLDGEGLPGWDEFWSWVRSVASRASLYLLDDGPRLECPWPVLAGLVTVEDLMEGSVTVDDADLTNVRQGHLRRRFDARLHRARQETYGQVPAVAAFLTGRALPAGDGPRRILPAPADG